MICQNCGNELREESAYCDKCGTEVLCNTTQQPPKSAIETIEEKTTIQDFKEPSKASKKKWIPILSAVGIVIIIGIILIALAMRTNVAPTNGDNINTQTTQLREPQKELTEEEKLRNRYIEESNNNSNVLCLGISNVAEYLLRGQHVFMNAKIRLTGEVASIMSPNSNNFNVSIKPNYYDDDDLQVKHVIIRGTYADSENRLVKGDIVSATGTFAGVGLFEMDSKSNAEFAILDECKLYNNNEFSIEDIKKVVKSVFGDVNTEVKMAEDDGGAGIKFTRINAELNRIENWEFYQYGNICLSLNGAEHYQVVQFDLDCQHYYVINYDEDYVICQNITYYDLAGHEIWKKEFEKGCQSYQVAEGVIYIYANNEVRILNNHDGTDKIKPVYMPEKKYMYVCDDMIYILNRDNSTDAIVALDLSGNMVWRFSLDNKFTLSDITKVENELLIESYFNDRSSNDSKTYYRYKRINTKTGQLVSEFKMPNDYN